MTKKSKVFYFFLFMIFICIGWQFGFSPIKRSYLTSKEKSKFLIKQFSVPQVDVDPDYILPDQMNIDVLHYYLNIGLFTKEKILKGDVTITGVLLDKNMKEIDLNFYDNFKIDTLQLDGKISNYENKGTRLTIPLTSAVPDTFKIRVVYSGTPKRLGLAAFVFGEINNNSCVYNLSEPNFASTWFPCDDRPDDKALLDIKITNDSSQVSASNGKLIGVYNEGARKTYYWKTIYPISTYLICLYSSNYVEFKDHYVSLNKKDTMAIDYFVFPKDLKEGRS